MITTKEINELARRARVPGIRAGRTRLAPAHKHAAGVAQATDRDALVALRTAISTFGAPRTGTFVLGIVSLVLILVSVALGLGIEVPWADGDSGLVSLSNIYVVIGIIAGVALFSHGLNANSRTSSAAGWLFLLDQRIAELGAPGAGPQMGLFNGRAELIGIKFGGNSAKS